MKKLWILALLFTCTTAANAQPFGLSPLEAYSVFVENYKNDSYQTAAIYGRWLIKHRPRTLEELPQYKGERNFERMVKIYTEWSKTFEDPTKRSAYLDSAVTVFDLVYETYEEDEIDRFDWHYKQGRFYQSNADYIDDGLSKAYAEYGKLVKMDAQRAAELGRGYYVKILVQNYVSKNEKEMALSVMEKTEPYANQDVIDFYDKMRNELFDDPEERVGFLEEKLNENPENEEVLVELLELYEDQEMMDKARQTAGKLYELNPSYDNVMRVAENALSNANYDRAIKYLKEAKDKTDQKEALTEIAMELADAYKNMDQLQEARKYAREALSHDENLGRAYIQIAQIYSQAVNQCTSDRKMSRQDKVVYWLVLDYLDKAKAVDSSLSNSVERQYQSYEPVLPSAEDKFYWKPPLEAGDKIKVDSNLDSCYGWINETTTVR
ncbi:MAG: tetratricopeptide repeat protein [Bacteroidota bacterium]